MVPKLRFKKFTNAWCESLLGNLVDIKSGNSPSTYELSYEGDYPFVKVEDMNNCTKYQIDAREYVINSNFCFPVGSVIFPKRGAAIMNNKVRILNKNSCADTNMMALIAKHINPEFLYYLVNLIGLYKIADTSTIPQINNKHILPFKVNIPSEEEQTKIANFLASIDTKITLLNKQYVLLCQYKKGVMQKIFSQELRFRNENGNIYPNWKIKPFRKLYSLLSTNSLSRNELNYENGVIKNIHYGDIHTKFNCRFDINIELVPYISKEVKIPEENFCRTGDLVIADTSEDYNDIGKCIEIMNVGQRQIVAGLHTFLARPSTNMAPGFGSYMMQSSEVRKQIKVIATGVSVLSITKKNLSELMLPLPSIDEQIKIANFLAAVDDKIITKKTELDKLTTWKQGLLQQMFV